MLRNLSRLQIKREICALKYYLSSSTGGEYEYHGRLIRRPILESLKKTLKICIVGSGPAGLYTADRLLKRFKSKVEIDILDRLSSPFGLVSTGVAPDHPETKLVKNSFINVLEDPQCSFFGKITVGKDISLKHLQQWYHGVVLAYGAEGDIDLEVQGENLKNIISARQFVWWYNGHPDLKGYDIDLSKVTKVLIIGMGNVALDCARILLKNTVELEKTDISVSALESLRNSDVKSVTLAARRGPAQVKFTPKELKELIFLEGVRFEVDSLELKIHPKDQEFAQGSRIKRRNLDLLKRAYELSRNAQFKDEPFNKKVKFIFERQVVNFEPKSKTKDNSSQVGYVTFERMRMTDSYNESQYPPYREKRTSIPTGKFEKMDFDFVIKSIGYRPIPIKGLNIDESGGFVPNKDGRVLICNSNHKQNLNETVHNVPPDDDDAPLHIPLKSSLSQEIRTNMEKSKNTLNESSDVVPGLYVCGWLRRGPTGIIGTNLIDSEQVVESIFYDCLNLAQKEAEGQDKLRKYLHKEDIRFSTFEDWQETEEKKQISKDQI